MLEVEDDSPRINPREPYFAQLEKLVRFEVIKKAKGSFVCDALHGCGAGCSTEYSEAMVWTYGDSEIARRAV